jgi:hypothetical protein
MFRRTFLSSIGAFSLAEAFRQPSGGSPVTPSVLVWRQYSLRTGTQPRRLADYLQNALIPAVNRLGRTPVGVFEVTVGLPSQTIFVLIPFESANALASLESDLDKDEAFMRAAAAYNDATAADAVYVRQENWILSAFPQMPRVQVPAATAAKGPRLFELRIYESHNERAHRAKVKMFAEMGEIEIFRKAGLTPVFFARTLAGPRMPSLVYMLVHDNMAGRDKSWDNFRTDPDWRKLSQTPGFTDPEIVSNITTIFLRPAAYSQI